MAYLSNRPRDKISEASGIGNHDDHGAQAIDSRLRVGKIGRYRAIICVAFIHQSTASCGDASSR